MPLASATSEEVASRPAQSDIQQPEFPASSDAGSPWWPRADFAVLGIWIAVAGFALRYHEKWADEAQAWLLARDLDLHTLWLKELRYEGSPGLWHTILWFAQRVFHARYASIGIIGMVFATAGVALVLFKAPFPRPLRWLLAFSYFMVYQYAVIARPYTLLPLLCFAAAIFFRDQKHPERIGVVLILLANLSLHGTLLAAAIGLAYLVEAMGSWQMLEERVRARHVLCFGALALTFFCLFAILKPTPDVEEFAVKRIIAQHPELVGAGRVSEPSKLAKLTSVVSGAFLDNAFPSSIFILLAGVWCYMRRKLLVFALPVALMIVLYTVVHGYSHHHGTVFVAAITGLWIAWPTAAERREFTKTERWATHGMTALLVCLFYVNIADAAVVIDHEYHYPYSGAEDAAKYLKSVGADRRSIFGYQYGMVGVQAYFDHNILANSPNSYFHHGLPLVPLLMDLNQLELAKPDYVIVTAWEDPQKELDEVGEPLGSVGYELVRFSDGYMFNKRTVYVRQVYFIFRRMTP